MNKRKSLLGALLFLSISLVNGQETGSYMSLTQLIDSALHNNYLLKANQKNVMISQSEIELLRTNYLPMVTTSASFSFWRFLMPNKQRLLGNSRTDMYTDVTVYQKIYDWGERDAKQSIIEEEIRLTDEISREIRNTITWGVTNAYFETLKAESEIEVRLNSLQQLSQQLQYADNLYQIGKASGVDILKVNVQISIEEKNLAQTRNMAHGRLIELKRLAYLSGDYTFKPEELPEDYYESYKKSPFDVDSIYSIVLLNHPALLATDRKIDIEMKQAEVIKLETMPELYSYALGTWAHGYLPFGNNFNYNIGLGIRYTIPMWGGSGYKSRIISSGLKADRLNHEKSQIYHDIRKEIDLAINSIKDAGDEIYSNQRIINLAEETLDNSLVKYQAGQGPVIDVLDAQSILTEATISYKRSMLSYLQALARLHYLTGSDSYPF